MPGRHAASTRPCLWICRFDDQAQEALQWAEQNRVAVPRDMAILSLENRPKFYHLGISSCTFDWESVGYLMAHAIIGDVPLAQTSRGFIKTRAVVLERGTTP